MDWQSAMKLDKFPGKTVPAQGLGEFARTVFTRNGKSLATGVLGGKNFPDLPSQSEDKNPSLSGW
jgi:hypothetical protein